MREPLLPILPGSAVDPELLSPVDPGSAVRPGLASGVRRDATRSTC